MSRTSAMATGFILIFLGLQFFLVRSYTLTPRTTRFMAEHFGNSPGSAGAMAAQSPSSFSPWYGGGSANPQTNLASTALSTSSFGQKRLTPPKWLCWPCLFVGTVFYFHGLAMRKNE